MKKAVSLKLATILFTLITWIPFAYSAEDWKKTIDSVKESILMIEKETIANLENEGAGCYQATGFIVDAEKGLILTNRHVVGTSPSTARATFWNKEKISIEIVYYDPIHDYGLYKFNPKDLRWTKPKALKLGNSDQVKIGEEIRVLGNNAAEGFSILEGTVSWVKKNAPTYSDSETYRELNTYYFQTSANVSGGSSGGPIINKAGEVVAINSSSINYTTVSWGLPINAVKLALDSIRQGKQPIRGDLGARIISSTFDEIIEFGFPKTLINFLKKKNKYIEGLLTVAETLPETDASNYLKAGDVIWQLDGVNIEDSFSKYEKILNPNVGRKIPVKVIREGKTLSFNIEVLDLDKLKLKSFIRIGRDHFSNIPIFLGYLFNVPLRGVFAPAIKYNFSEREDFPEFLIITELAGNPIQNTGDFLERLRLFKDGDKVKIKYKVLREDKREEEKVIKIDWKWFKPEYFKLNESNHEWIKQY